MLENEYRVVDSSYVTPISNTVMVNDTGVLHTEIRYLNIEKNERIGTSQTSFVLEPETSQTAILK